MKRTRACGFTSLRALALASLALISEMASAAEPPVGPDKVMAPSIPNVPSAFVSSCVDSTASPWAAIGLARPNWVDVCAERRLRLLPALPGIAQSITQDVNGYFADKGPGLAIGLVLDDGLFFSQGFGFRDLQKRTPPDEMTLFNPGSLSKVMTTTGLLTLVDEPTKNMSLAQSADLPAYLPELKSVCPAGPNPQTLNTSCTHSGNQLKIQLLHLVSHTSGLPNVLSAALPPSAPPATSPQDVWRQNLQNSEILFPPGTYSAYSGVAIEAVGLLLETRVSGEPTYTDFIAKHLFQPLGMTHSSMDQSKVPQDLLAQKWTLKWAAGPPPGLSPTWSWSAGPDAPYTDEEKVLLPAGGLTTSVWDLSRFLKMWLTGVAPTVTGRPLIRSTTLKAAYAPQVSTSTPPPKNCGGISDPNNAGFSGCGKGNTFGVGWVVSSSPFIWHNGKHPGFSGSETVFNASAKMAATGLVSTDPYPDATNFQPHSVQPASLDASFIDTVVWTHLLFPGINADGNTTWKGAPLSEGVARLLWLSGVDARGPIIGPVKNPILRPPVVEHPNVAVKAELKKGGKGQKKAEPPPGQQGQPPTPEQHLLAQFTTSFRGQNQLKDANVAQFVAGLFGDVHRCSTFRVRHVFNVNKVSLRLECRNRKSSALETLDLTLTVDSAGRIAALDDVGATSRPY
jgi:CubicO group peptidase (beta-lactamase class C family)